jgi:hypothetical protein
LAGTIDWVGVTLPDFVLLDRVAGSFRWGEDGRVGRYRDNAGGK